MLHGTTIVYAREPEPEIVEVIEWNEERIDSEIETQALAYNVSADEMKATIQCESGGSTTIQSRHIRPDGTREQSYGLAQFHIPAGNKTPDGIVITKEMAQDPKIAIESMAYHFSIGHQKKWTCWKKLFN